MAIHTPVLLIVFNRPDLTRQLFEEVRKVKPDRLFIAADGPRIHKLGEEKLCIKARAIFDEVDWPCEVKTIYRTENLGCKVAVSSAIDWFFEHVEFGIILEDDCLPNISFFYFCEELLGKYEYDEKIHIIGGNFFQKNRPFITSYYFSRYPHIWGWATWKRAWKHYDVNIASYQSGILNTETFKGIFNSKRELKYWAKIFDRCKNNEIDTWDYQLTYSIWRQGGICISPSVNLVVNTGFENQSTHYFLKDSFKCLKTNEMNFPLVHPTNLNINRNADIYTFENLFSHSLTRVKRLIKENSLKNIIRYFLYKMKS